MNKLIGIAILVVIGACKPTTENSLGAQLKSTGDKLEISYRGEGDSVQFKMFQGLEQILKKNTDGVFEGVLEIPDLDDGIFSYDIIIHKQNSSGKMIKLDYEPEVEGENHSLWIGKNRNSFSKAAVLNGDVITKELESRFLDEKRKLTIYTPKKGGENIPVIYLTDGSVVDDYAPYVDKMISEGEIMPVKLVGVHSSRENRYKEYIDDGIENELFKKHQDFFYKEVLSEIEDSMENWSGKRYIYGFSNGSAFCMHAGLYHPKLFKEVIAFSTVGYISQTNRIEFKFQSYPKFYMGAGRYEENTLMNNVYFVSKMEENNIHVEFKEYISGHDYTVWRIEFMEYLQLRFGN